MSIDPDVFRLRPGKRADLAKRPTRVKPFYATKQDYREQLAARVKRLDELQAMHYACSRHALLVIFQAMDAAGKDGAIRHVFSGLNPQGCQVFSFKPPSAEELAHDFLWRTTLRLPARGQIGVFNRSYYEETLVVRVHPELLAAQGVAAEDGKRDAFWEERFRSIAEHEAHLHRNGTRIVKFFLHLSKAEQRERFLARIDKPEKNWKFSLADVRERKRWADYQAAYEACLGATSTKHAPWYIVPADDKKNARLIVAETLVRTMEAMEPSYPETTPARRKELRAIRDEL